MRTGSCFLALLMSVPCAWAEDAVIARSVDWPQWRGPRRDAVSTESGLLNAWPKEGPKLLWNSKTVAKDKSVGTGYSSVAVAPWSTSTLSGFPDVSICFRPETHQPAPNGPELRLTNGTSNVKLPCTVAPPEMYSATSNSSE